MKNSGNENDRTEFALKNLISARDALIREIASSQGKSRLHAVTFAAVCASIKAMEDITKISPSPKPGKKKPIAEK